MKRYIALVIALVLAMTCGVVGLAVSAQADGDGAARPPTKVTRKPNVKPAFSLGAQYGPLFAGFGVDVKKAFHAQVTARSQFPGLVRHRAIRYARVPFSAMSVKDGHFDPTNGSYLRQVTAMKAMRAANPGIRFYLNRKNWEGCPAKAAGKCLDFHNTLKDNGQVTPWKYGRLIAEVAHYFRKHGVPARFIGPENELHNNEARLTPGRFDAVVRALRRNYRYPFTVVGNDTWNMQPSWVRQSRTPQVGAIHSSVRKWGWQQDHLRRAILATRGKGLPAWNTEFHWDHWSKGWLQRNAGSLKQILTQVCWGLRTVMFWDMNEAQFRYAVMQSVAGSRCRRVTSTMPGVYVYANSKGHVWVVNKTSRTYARKVKRDRFAFTRWTKPTPWSSRTQGRLRFPSRSITLIRLR
jgi:hypothetical protein